MHVDKISQELGFPKPTVYRLVRILVKNGLMEQDTERGGYRLGIRLLQMANVVMCQRQLADIARPFMEELRDITKESVSLNVIENGQVFVLREIEGIHPIRMAHREGSMTPAYAGAHSKVLMAYLSAEIQDRIIQKGLVKYTQNTIVDPVKLKKELKSIIENGYAFSDQELEIGARAIAAPVRDFSKRTIASIGLAGPAYRFDHETVKRFVPLVKEYAEKTSYQMGFNAQ